ncbi:hypothetical protein [Amycolatopsis samaneae]|uniref:DUF4878 domain-containing protein n=1 Tax=Amycolatopsis samaneae TaxID=664691 RepID=A0ABW5G7Q4_9PSEU
MSKRDLRVGAAVVALLAWIATITLLIAHEPEAGAGSATDLRDRLATALATRDADALANLVDYGGKDSGDFAKSYVAKLDEGQVQEVSVRLAPDEREPTHAVVTGVRAHGERFSYPLAVAEAKGRWKVAFTPPLP